MLLSLKKTSDTQVCSHFPPCLLRTSGSLSFTTCQKIPLSTVNLSLPSRLHVNPVKHFQGFFFFFKWQNLKYTQYFFQGHQILLVSCHLLTSCTWHFSCSVSCQCWFGVQLNDGSVKSFKSHTVSTCAATPPGLVRCTRRLCLPTSRSRHRNVHCAASSAACHVRRN